MTSAVHRIEKPAQVARQRTDHFMPYAARGRRPREAMVVKRVTRQPELPSIPIRELATRTAQEDPVVHAVQLVTHERVPDRIEVDADLVLTAGARATGEEREFSVSLDDAPFGS